MFRRFTSATILAAVIAIFPPGVFAALTVTAPPAGSTPISAGDDYATQVVGDAWDMNNTQDVDTDEALGSPTQSFSGGLFNVVDTVAACGTGVFPSFMGYGTTTVKTARGQLYPIDTTVYRYFTMKLKATGGAATQNNQVFYFKDGDSRGGTNLLGATSLKSISPNQWTYVTWDLYTESSNVPWTSLPYVEGIEVIPCNGGSPNIQFDWIRITAPSSAAQTFNVAWTDSGSTTTYTITAIDGDGARFQFASGVGSMSFSADFSRLAPGDYHVEVKRADATTTLSTGVVHVNFPPQVNIASPSVRGEQSKSYALTQQGVQWAVPMSAVDFQALPNFTGVTYVNPSFPGSFSGRPTNLDPQFIMKTTGHPINSSLYRSACFTQEVFGPRSVGLGSVARLFWGPSSSTVSTTTDIILGSGLVEYCLPDLADVAAVPLVGGGASTWAGNLNYFRMDPDEFTPPGGCSTPQTCHDVRLDSIILSPFAAANPTYTINLTVTDPDFGSGGSIQIFLDPDKTFNNGNEIGVATVPYTIGSYKFVADQDIPNATYYLVLLADDGKNAVAQYAGGKIVTDHSDVIFRDGFQ